MSFQSIQFNIPGLAISTPDKSGLARFTYTVPASNFDTPYTPILSAYASISGISLINTSVFELATLSYGVNVIVRPVSGTILSSTELLLLNGWIRWAGKLNYSTTPISYMHDFSGSFIIVNIMATFE